LSPANTKRRRRRGEPVYIPSLSDVELVMALEETFGPDALPDEGDDDDRFATVGDLKRAILARVALVPGSDCATQRAFYRLRRAVCEALSVPRSAVRPGTRWRDLRFPWGRRIGWCAIGRRVRKSLPDLCVLPSIPSVPGDVAPLLTVAVGLIVASSILAATGHLDPEMYMVFALLVLAATPVAFLLSLVIGPLPVHRHTVGDTARLLAALDEPAAPPGRTAWMREEVSRTVDRIFVETTGVHDFTDDSIIRETW